MHLIQEIAPPQQASIIGHQQAPSYCDAFQFRVSSSNLSAPYVYHAIFGFLPKPVQWALSLRNRVVKYLGFAASETKMSLALDEIVAGNQAGFLTIEKACEQEVVCAAYEDNMDLWLSVLKLSDDEFALSTLVNLKTPAGRYYMAVIKPFHRLVARYSIRQALKSGRL